MGPPAPLLRAWRWAGVGRLRGQGCTAPEQRTPPLRAVRGARGGGGGSAGADMQPPGRYSSGRDRRSHGAAGPAVRGAAARALLRGRSRAWASALQPALRPAPQSASAAAVQEMALLGPALAVPLLEYGEEQALGALFRWPPGSAASRSFEEEARQKQGAAQPAPCLRLSLLTVRSTPPGTPGTDGGAKAPGLAPTRVVPRRLLPPQA